MKKNIIEIIIASICIILFIIILYTVQTKKINSLDQLIYEKISRFINPTNTKFMKIITIFGSVIGIAFGVFISYFFLKDKFDKSFITLAMLGEAALNNVIKVIIKRPRPTINPLVVETGYSFPSGHTMSSTAFFSLLIFFLWKSHLPTKIKIIITIPFVCIIGLVLTSRVYLGVHYFSDVFAGLLLSLACILLLSSGYPKIKKFFL